MFIQIEMAPPTSHERFILDHQMNLSEKLSHAFCKDTLLSIALFFLLEPRAINWICWQERPFGKSDWTIDTALDMVSDPS